MTVHTDELRSIYRDMDSEELLARVSAGTLTEEAQVLASEELANRGVTPQITQPEVSTSPVLTKKGNFFLRAFSGKEQLWAVFWIAGFILNIPRGVAFVFHSVPLHLLGIIPQLFWLACVWRSAPRSSHHFWALLARFFVVLILGILVFAVVLNP